MSVSVDLKGSAWAAQMQQDCPNEAAEYWSKLELYSKKKLWHQMSQTILEFMEKPFFTCSALTFYEQFVSEFESKMKKLSLVEVIKRAVAKISEIEDAEKFLEKASSKVNDCVMSTILIKVILGATILRISDDRKKVKEIIEEVEKEIDGLGIVPQVHSRFYELASKLYQIEANHGLYYKNSLKYLGVIDLKSMSSEDKQAKAFSIGISALLASDVYNMGELLQHDILASLNNTSNAWLVDLLEAFNSGNINLFQSTSSQWQSQTDLKAASQKLYEKMCLMCLMEMTFVRPANDRALSFAEIAEKTNLGKSDVESLIIRALSLNLVKGSIDEVAEKVHMTWVQPRVLSVEQIDRMRVRIGDWVKEVGETEKMMEEKARPILSH